MCQVAESCNRRIYLQVYQFKGIRGKKIRAQDVGQEFSCKDYGRENAWGTREQF